MPATLRADVVHTHLVHADVYGGLAARLRGTHLVSTKHNDDPFRVGPFRFVERGLSRLADRVITITDALHRFTVERVGVPADKVETIHYGLDGLPEAWGVNPPDDVPEDARVLLAISRLTEQKGIDVAIRALAGLPDDTVLVVLGDGPERAALVAPRAGARASSGASSCSGACPTSRAWLRRATLLVHPARWEGFGLAVLEAMLAGLPVVATNVSALPELVVDGETGLLVRAGRRGSARARRSRGARAAAARRGRARARAHASSPSAGWRTAPPRSISSSEASGVSTATPLSLRRSE